MKKIVFLGGLVGLFLLSTGSVLAESYGWSPQTDFSGTYAPICTDSAPGTPVLYEPFHPLLPKSTVPGTIRLNWAKAQRANNYTVVYGLSSKNYIYGATNVGNTDNLTVRSLVPGRTYYFAIRGVNGCMPGSLSNEWAARAVGGSGGGVSLAPATGFVPAPTVTTTKPIIPDKTTTITLPTQAPVQSEAPAILPTPKPASTGFFDRVFGFFGKIFGL